MRWLSGASLTAGTAVGWLQHAAAQVARNDPNEVQAAKPQLAKALAGRPVNIMIIGSDRRAGQPDVGARSDTLMVVRLDPQTGSISMLSVPRDLMVTIPGYGPNKINAAYSFGGARLSLEVVKQLLGIPINDFIDMNFDGFTQVVNKLGGAYLMIDHSLLQQHRGDRLRLDRHRARLPAPERLRDPRLGALPPRPERRLHPYRAPADLPARDETRADGLGPASPACPASCR